MHAPEDAVITVHRDGRTVIDRAGADGRVVYSRAQLIAEGITFTPSELERLAGQLTSAATAARETTGAASSRYRD